MEVVNESWKLILQTLYYAVLVGGAAIIIPWIEDGIKAWKAWRRKRRNAKISNHETQRTR
ncbi:MAG: hypothetical protein IJZ68_09510 [Bacteroidaceae bacterium]|nr:hypothetical protein [Bacteroidaceae bacterium]